MNKKQTEKATKLLGLLCDSNFLTNVQVASFFDNDAEAVLICKELKRKRLLNATFGDGNKIIGLDKNEETCNAFKTNILLKEFVRNIKIVKKEHIELKIKQIELFKQYWWVAGIILAIILWILFLI